MQIPAEKPKQAPDKNVRVDQGSFSINPSVVLGLTVTFVNMTSSFHRTLGKRPRRYGLRKVIICPGGGQCETYADESDRTWTEKIATRWHACQHYGIHRLAL
jgi:hypothetical protein